MVPPDAFHGSIDTDCAHYPTLSGMNDAAATVWKPSHGASSA
jgi:hypothetical protein